MPSKSPARPFRKLRRWTTRYWPARTTLGGFFVGLASFWALLVALRWRRPMPTRARRLFVVTADPALKASSSARPKSLPDPPTKDLYPRTVSAPHQLGPDGPIVGASPAAVRAGFEPLATSTLALGVLSIVFVVVFSGTLVGLWFLLKLYMVTEKPEQLSESAASPVSHGLLSPLQPSPQNDDLDWQALVHVRQRENLQFRRLGWSINSTTGQAILPRPKGFMPADRAISLPTSVDALRFPPPYATVPAGPYELLSEADVFPPVGAAADSDQMHESIHRPPSATANVDDLPGQSGPADLLNNPTVVPTNTTDVAKATKATKATIPRPFQAVDR